MIMSRIQASFLAFLRIAVCFFSYGADSFQLSLPRISSRRMISMSGGLSPENKSIFDQKAKEMKNRKEKLIELCESQNLEILKRVDALTKRGNDLNERSKILFSWDTLMDVKNWSKIDKCLEKLQVNVLKKDVKDLEKDTEVMRKDYNLIGEHFGERCRRF